LALSGGQESEQANLVLAHMGLDRKRHRCADRRQLLQSTRRAMHEIADTMDVEDHEVLADAVDRARQLADHGARPSPLPPCGGGPGWGVGQLGHGGTPLPVPQPLPLPTRGRRAETSRAPHSITPPAMDARPPATYE